MGNSGVLTLLPSSSPVATARERGQRAWLNHRLSHPVSIDALDLPDDARVRFLDGGGHVGMATPEPHIVDGSPSCMTQAFLEHISLAAARHRWVEERRIDLDHARDLLRETESALSQALECCHFGVMPARELARRLGLAHTTVISRVRRAKERVEEWTHAPISDPVNREDPNVRALAAKWGGGKQEETHGNGGTD